MSPDKRRSSFLLFYDICGLLQKYTDVIQNTIFHHLKKKKKTWTFYFLIFKF